MSSILVFSDLYWHKNQRNITDDDVEKFRIDDLDKKKFEGIQKYVDIIRSKMPDMVLFAGDVTGDGSCGHGFSNAFILLLKVVEGFDITSFYISGDHDEKAFYSKVMNYSNRNLNSTKDISGKIVEFRGISILGISFRHQSTTNSIKTLLRAYRGRNIDILLTHTENRRRLWLFEFGSKIIITGHYDKRSFSANGSRYISLDNDHGHISYAVLKDIKSSGTVEYVIATFEYGLESISFKEKIIENESQKRNSTAYINNNLKVDLSKFENLDPKVYRIATSSSLRRIMKMRGEDYSYIEKQLPINFNQIKYLDKRILKKIRGEDLSKAFSNIIKMGKADLDIDKTELKNMINRVEGVSKSLITNYLGRII